MCPQGSESKSTDKPQEMFSKAEMCFPKVHLSARWLKVLEKDNQTLPLKVQLMSLQWRLLFLRPHFHFYLFPLSAFFKMIKDVEMHNLAKSYLAELIKEECWNSMAVKGRALKVTDRTLGTKPDENCHQKLRKVLKINLRKFRRSKALRA